MIGGGNPGLTGLLGTWVEPLFGAEVKVVLTGALTLAVEGVHEQEVHRQTEGST